MKYTEYSLKISKIGKKYKINVTFNFLHTSMKGVEMLTDLNKLFPVFMHLHNSTGKKLVCSSSTALYWDYTLAIGNTVAHIPIYIAAHDGLKGRKNCAIVSFNKG